ncbi:MAG: hypothetical protein L3K03_07075 [Thermoplasmata archaeon]|nr:hypothetical protein [Thermoplasmata archaeon]
MNFHSTGFQATSTSGGWLGNGSSQSNRSNGSAVATGSASAGRSSSDVPFGSSGGVIVEGTVLRAEPLPHVPISGATVSVQAVGQACVPSCPTVLTNNSGRFTANNVDPGTILVTVVAGDNMTNYTTLFGVTAGTVSAGTIYLVPDAIVSGCIKAAGWNTSVPGVRITASTRDGALEASPAFYSGSNGCFNTPGVAVPPGPAVIDFTPPEGTDYLNSQNTYVAQPSPYLPNNTFVDLGPGQHYNLPFTVYLTVGVNVTVTPWNSVTKHAITSGQGFVAITLRSRLTGVSFGQGTALPIGTAPYAFAPPGSDTLTVDMDGFLENSSPVFVRSAPLGTTVNLGVVWLVPEGVVAGSTGFTWPSAVKSSDWYDETTTGNCFGQSCVPVADVVLTVCSLDGLLSAYSTTKRVGLGAPTFITVLTSSTCQSSCQTILSPFAVYAAPLRVHLQVEPDTTGSCIPGEPTWPTNLLLPVWGNTSFANITAAEVTRLPAIDLTAGTFVQGVIKGEGGAWTITACSTDEVSLCLPTSGPINTPGNGGRCNSISDQGQYSYCPYDPLNCPSPTSTNANQTFCVAVPPGPVRLAVSSTASNAGNLTWAQIPPGVFGGPLSLASVTADHETSINLSTHQGTISGTLDDSVTGQPVPNWFAPTATASPAGQSVTGGGISVAQSGKFNITTGTGWFSVEGAASDYVDNESWADVVDPGASVSVGTLNLTPVSWIQGEVLEANGTPIVYATVQTCDIDLTDCQPALDSGITGTGGQFTAKLAAGVGTSGAYAVEASAPGYISNFTWVNVTVPGAEYVAPPIHLTPFLAVGEGAFAAPGYGSPSPDLFEYLTGSIVDNTTGEGIPLATLTLSPVVGGGMSSSPVGSITDAGAFNYTVATGQYWANVTDSSYYPQSFFLNLSGLVPQLDLGAIRLEPFTGYVDGQLSIASWSANLTATGLGPGAVEVSVCLASDAAVCGTGTADSSGFFNVSAPWGYHDAVYIDPDGSVPGDEGSAAFGFVNATSNANVVNGSSGTFVRASLTIFGGVEGDVRDNSTEGVSPVRYGQLSLSTVNPKTGTRAAATEALTGGGNFTVFVPPGTVVGLAWGSAYVPYNFTSPVDLPNVTATNLTSLAPISLRHFGWITGDVLAPDGGPGVAGAGIISQWFDPSISAYVTGTSTSNGVGFFNVTAPPAPTVAISINAPDFNGTQASRLPVNQSQTFHLTGALLPALVPWGWVKGTVTDPTFHVAVPFASVTIVDSATGTLSSKPAVTTSATGEFLTDAVPGPKDLATIQSPDFLTNSSGVAVTPGNVTEIGSIRLTAMGIVAGDVLGLPAGVRLDGAQVTVCAFSASICSSYPTITNEAGIFWALAPPGTDRINASFAGYAPNVSLVVKVTPDSWQWAGSVILSEYATLAGTILGLPSGLTLDDANASLCSTIVYPGEATGSCGVTVPTSPTGTFSLSAPGGTYILALSAPDFASAYLPVSVRPGEAVNLGTLFLDQGGTITGTVVGQDTDSPVAGTQVFACPTEGEIGCTGVVGVNTTGGFTLTTLPGPYLVTATAPGYEESFSGVQVMSGARVSAGLLQLIPVGSSQLFSVTGSIVGWNNSGPIAGATVISAGVYSSAGSSANGSYSILVPWGSYDLMALAAGYNSANATVTVHSNRSGINFILYPSAFTLTGTIRDGLTNDVLSGAKLELSSTGATIATTDADGQYQARLANGTYEVTVVDSGTANYQPLSVIVSINGGDVQRDMALYPPSTEIDGLVVDSGSGLPVAFATVTIGGTTSTGIPWSTMRQSSSVGTVEVQLYSGTYTVQVNATGYSGVHESLVPQGTVQQVVVSLPPMTNGSSGPTGGASSGGSSNFLYGTAAALGAVVILTMGVLAWRARRPGAAP